MAKGKKTTIRIKSVDVRKSMVAGAVFWGIIGFVVGLIYAIPALLLGQVNAIIVIVLAPITASILGWIGHGVVSSAKNFALHVSKGYDIEVEM